MSTLELFFGKNLEKKHDKRVSRELAEQLGEFLVDEKNQEKIVSAINEALTKLSKKDSDYALLVLHELQNLKTDVNKKYPFKITQ